MDVSTAYKKTGRTAKKSFRTLAHLDELRSMLEDEMFNECREDVEKMDDHDRFEIYYGESEIPKIKTRVVKGRYKHVDGSLSYYNGVVYFTYKCDICGDEHTHGWMPWDTPCRVSHCIDEERIEIIQHVSKEDYFKFSKYLKQF